MVSNDGYVRYFIIYVTASSPNRRAQFLGIIYSADFRGVRDSGETGYRLR